MDKNLLKSKKIKVIFALITIIICTGAISIASKAQTDKRAANIKSKGIFDYDNGTVVMDASDLTYLADEIDLLEDTYKKETVRALNKINTYFMMDNSTTHNPNESNLDTESSTILPFESIIDGILDSQSIPIERTYTGMLPGKTNQTTGNISAAAERNLSLGTAAWVDGELITGTGADNSSYYSQGKTEGYNQGKTEGYNQGKTEGYDQGHSEGYDQGYTEGVNHGKTVGYNQGYTEGVNSCNLRLYCPATDGESSDTANFPAGTYTLSGIYKGFGLYVSYIRLDNVTTGEAIYSVSSDPNDENTSTIFTVSETFTLSSDAVLRLTTSGSKNYGMNFSTAGVK